MKHDPPDRLVPGEPRLRRALLGRRAGWSLLLALVVSVRGLGAQETIQIDSLGRKPAAKPDDGGFRWTPLLAPGYNPEMGLLIAGGFLFSAKLGRKDSTLQRSTLSSTVSISTTGAINVSGVLTSFFLQNRLRVLVNVGYKTMPDSYWGVGYDAGLEPTSQDSTTKYHRAWWQVNPRAYWGVRKHLYVGGGVDLNRTIATEVNPTMAADPYYLRYGHDNFNSGLTAAIFYDSRDVAVNAWRGLYLSLTGTFYGSYLGSNNTYQIYLLDYRQYRTLGRPGRTLAWQVKSRLGAKNVPWAELSPLGTGYDLRGYREGRFRDETTLLALVEFRQMFTRSGGRLSRHGFVAWAGGGTLGSSFKDLNGFLPNGGIGYRFELQPRSNVRVDVGFGKKSNGVYFNFTEAF